MAAQTLRPDARDAPSKYHSRCEESSRALAHHMAGWGRAGYRCACDSRTLSSTSRGTVNGKLHYTREDSAVLAESEGHPTNQYHTYFRTFPAFKLMEYLARGKGMVGGMIGSMSSVGRLYWDSLLTPVSCHRGNESCCGWVVTRLAAVAVSKALSTTHFMTTCRIMTL